MTKRYRSPLGYAVRQLVSGRASAREVFNHFFAGCSMAAPLLRVLKHGSLKTGELLGPRYTSKLETIPRPSWQPPLEFSVDRDGTSVAAGRILACLLIHMERIDPKSGKACGSIMWQGNTARRLGLSLVDRGDGNPYGAREVQRYVRILARGEVLRVTQPPDSVPEFMRARPKPTRVRGRSEDVPWSYNVVSACDALPPAIREALEQWRGVLKPAPLNVPAAAVAAIDYCTDAETAAAAQAVLALLRAPPLI